MKKKDFVILMVNLILCVCAFLSFKFDALESGLAFGVAVTMFVCGFKRYTAVLGILTQVVVLALLVLGIQWWIVYCIFAFLVPVTRVVLSTAPKGGYLVSSYFTGWVIPVIFVGIFYLLGMAF